MRRHGDDVVVSATDLVGFLECEHLTSLEIEAELGLRERQIRTDPELELIRKRGFEHEQRFLDRLRAEGRGVVDLSGDELKTTDALRTAAETTLAAMKAGAEVIFQATFFDGRWRGHADFLLRREDRPSNLGTWSYDIADTKLAKRVKAAAILQMCVYGDLLQKLQGIPPETVSVVTGDGVLRSHRLADYAAYYRAARTRFEERVFGDEALPETYPEPVDHCRVCPWFSVCIARRRTDDHLSIVANVSRSQRRRLVDAGIPTLGALASGGATSATTKIPPRILERLERQARLQLEARPPGHPGYELLPPRADDPGKGLAGLPEPSALDVFFDIEADPWAEEGGLEYLFGWAEATSDGHDYHAIWAHDRTGEKAALEAFVDMVMERLARDPAMHVYHYGAYESGALKRLMQRHATREDEIDVLLRGHVLVNLYDHVVRQALQAGLESYSIKKLETFYMPVREGGITQAGFSVVAYESWLESRDPGTLDEIAAYNRDDCVSDLLLRDWLEGLRIEALRGHPDWYPNGEIPRPQPEDGGAPETLVAEQAETRAREARLREGIPDDAAQRTPAEAARWLLAGLIDWNRREAKPQWWDYFRLVKASTEELVADPAALGELTFVEDRGAIAKSVLRRYSFDPAQETKLDEGRAEALPLDENDKTWSVDVIAFDALAGTVDIKTGWGAAHPRGLIAPQPPRTVAQRSALGRIADDVIERGIDAPGRYRAARDLLLRNAPRSQGPGGPLRGEAETALTAARRLALEIDAGVLAVQGPPGTGKTYAAARMIVDLIAAGHRVGVTAQSHRVIANVLEAVIKATREAGVQVGIGQKDDGDLPPLEGVERVGDNEGAHDGITSGRWSVLGGTAWLWSRPEFEGSVDVLFVDEAGQFSLANALAVSVAAPVLVLLGDPNQLPQVSNGVHPEGAGASALEHIASGATTIPPELGLFLDRTYRLHPRVNDYVSEAFYEGRLEPSEENARQVLGTGQPVGGVGIRHIPLGHIGATNRSKVEAAWISDAISALLGRQWTDRDGLTRALRVNDVLVVAPYNAQVAEIVRTVESRLGATPNVGTVDKFQGREAPVAIYSMTTSTPEDAPRDFEFLYSGNRLNVAISRAQGLAVLIATPALLQVACRSPEQMRLVSALCRLVEIAAEQAAEDRAAREPTPVADRIAVAVGGSDAPEELTLGLE